MAQRFDFVAENTTVAFGKTRLQVAHISLAMRRRRNAPAGKSPHKNASEHKPFHGRVATPTP